MNISKEVSKEITSKSGKLNELSIYLKQEFIGIDNIIDNVINSIKPYYIFNESLTKPIVINLWGMTGTGKSSLVEKIVDFLELRQNYLKYDMGDNDKDSFTNLFIPDKSELHPNSLSNIIVFDEFQLGKTLDNENNEIENKNRRIWELIDSGKIYVNNTCKVKQFKYNISSIKNLIKDFVVKNNFFDYEFNEEFASKIFGKYLPGYASPVCQDIDLETIVNYAFNIHPYQVKDYKNNGKLFIIPFDLIIKLVTNNPVYFNYKPAYNVYLDEFRNSNKTPQELIELLEDMVKSIPSMITIDYSKSVIFCMGNLDEMYNMTKDTNPDICPDVFHKSSLKLNITNVKNALKTRFRMEQIGRLGNNHFIYPAFSKDSYIKFIDKYLSNKRSYILDKYNLKLNINQSVNDIIYKEGVFPTQGIRPLISTLNNFIDSNISNIITDILLVDNKVKNVDMLFDNDSKSFIITNKKNINLSYKVETNLEDLRKIDNLQTQTLVAVHEAGHGLISCIRMGISPTEILSKTASESEGYCLFEYNDNLQTKDFLLKRIEVLLGGIEAERLIFGEENLSNGSYSDLSKATGIAYNIVKKYGMSKFSSLMSSTVQSDLGNNFVINKDVDIYISEIIDSCHRNVKNVLNENKSYLLKLSKVLIEKPKIYSDEIKEILSDLNIKWKDDKVYFNYVDVFNQQTTK